VSRIGCKRIAALPLANAARFIGKLLQKRVNSEEGHHPHEEKGGEKAAPEPGGRLFFVREIPVSV
jgi:hypothetical protein